MADTKASAFTVSTTPASTDLFPFLGGGTVNNITTGANLGKALTALPNVTTLTASTSITTPIVQSASTLLLKTNGTTTALTLGTDQSATFEGQLTGPVDANLFGIQRLSIGNFIFNSVFGASGTFLFNGSNSTVGLHFGNNFPITFSSSASANFAIMQAAKDTGIQRDAAARLKITDAVSGLGDLKLRTLINSGSANTAYWTGTGYSITGSGTTSMIDLAGTLNTSGVTDVVKIATTVTAAGAGSKLLNLYGGASGTTSVFSVGTDGNATFAGVASGATFGSLDWESYDAYAFQIARTVSHRNMLIGQNPQGVQMSSDYAIRWATTIASSGGVGQGDAAATQDTGIKRNAAGVLEVNNGTAGAFRDLKLRNIVGQTGYSELTEMTAPGAGAANTVRIYAEDNGSGKTRLMAIFPTGAAQQIAIEP